MAMDEKIHFRMPRIPRLLTLPFPGHETDESQRKRESSSLVYFRHKVRMSNRTKISDKKLLLLLLRATKITTAITKDKTKNNSTTPTAV